MTSINATSKTTNATFTNTTSMNTTSTNTTQNNSTIPPTTTSPISYPKVELCEKYETVEDDTRYLTSTNIVAQCDSHYKHSVRFMSSTGTSLQIMQGCEVGKLGVPIFPGVNTCQSQGLSWMVGSHPNVSDKAQVRTVCAFTSNRYYPSAGLGRLPGVYNYCECKERIQIYVQNCSGFYVYQLDPFYECGARYCMEDIPEGKYYHIA